MAEKPSKARTLQAPKGTRDFYPREMLVRRYITDAWRRVSLRHGFEEIDGPTFEFLDLYKVKSGEGIVSELFSFRREGGEDDYALRPEFTPTLARMYAARARQLPQPTKWFCLSNFFRAERPQRGRLREFWQWNCDVMGGDDLIGADGESAAVAIGALADLGLTNRAVQIRINHRESVRAKLRELSVPDDRMASAFELVDLLDRLKDEELVPLFQSRLGSTPAFALGVIHGFRSWLSSLGEPLSQWADVIDHPIYREWGWHRLIDLLKHSNLLEWFVFDPGIARGLAYYTSTVFEVIAEGERAVAGGGRYDNLIELFGGPPTPACGFGMGDAVLGNLLEDRGLIPEGRDMLEALARPMPMRADVFVVASESEAAQNAIVPLVARLRRGEESAAYKDSQASSDSTKRIRPWDAQRYGTPPLHARRSYKATKNIGKLVAEASACHARFAVIIEPSGEVATVKDLDQRTEQKDVALDKIGAMVAK